MYDVGDHRTKKKANYDVVCKRHYILLFGRFLGYLWISRLVYFLEALSCDCYLTSLRRKTDHH